MEITDTPSPSLTAEVHYDRGRSFWTGLPLPRADRIDARHPAASHTFTCLATGGGRTGCDC